MVPTREAMVQAMVGHVVQHGIAEASLRPLAQAAGTSDRMLIYHFGSKQGVIAEVLEALGRQFGEMLDAQLANEPSASRADCLRQLSVIARSPDMRPAMRVWMQILAAAAAGEIAYIETGRRIVQQMTGWIMRHLPAGDSDPVGTAKAMLAAIEGAIVLDLAGCSDVADTAIDRMFLR